MKFPLVLISAGFIANVLSESCFYQRCIGCRPEEQYNHHTTVECDPPNWVSPLWIHSSMTQPPPGTASRVPIEYRCLKMIAAPDDLSTGNTLDIIRGCVPRAQIDSVCLSLQALERARGRSSARCYACRGNDCNSSGKAHANQIVLSIFTILTSFFNLRNFM